MVSDDAEYYWSQKGSTEESELRWWRDAVKQYMSRCRVPLTEHFLPIVRDNRLTMILDVSPIGEIGPQANKGHCDE